jgi:glycosyltransferase involved in cell wall biosynthesis
MAMTQPKVTVIMNCLNGAEFLREALDSVFAQTLQDWELVFWDNASSDNSAEIARSYGERVRYFRGNSVVPLSTGRRLAAERARGEHLALIDTDDLWHPEFLAKATARLEAKPNCGVVWSDAWQIRADGTAIRKYSEFTRIYRGRQFERLLREQFISPSSAMVFRAAAVRAVGGWKDALTSLAEAELLLRIAARWEVDYCPEALVKWRLHASNTLGAGRTRTIWNEWQPVLRAWRRDPAAAGVPGAAFSQNALRLNLKIAQEMAARRRPMASLSAAARACGILIAHPSLAGTIPKLVGRCRSKPGRGGTALQAS